MDNAGAILTECPNCGVAPHTILRGRSGKDGRSLDATTKCTECGLVHHTTIIEKKDVKVRVIISDGHVSRKEWIELHPDEVLSVNDEFFAGTEYVRVRSIEVEGVRQGAARVGDIETVWAQRFDRLKVPVSVNRGSRTLSRYIFAAPDEEFAIGDVIKLERMDVAVHKLKTIGGGSPKYAPARDITRIYAKTVRH